MSRKIPISIRKLVELNNSRRLSNYVREEYLIQINEKQNNWEISKIFDREELLTLRNEINEILGLKTASEKLNCSIEEVEKYTSDVSFSDFEQNSMMLHASVRQLEIIGKMKELNNNKNT